jgi:hypothetical protein
VLFCQHSAEPIQAVVLAFGILSGANFFSEVIFGGVQLMDGFKIFSFKPIKDLMSLLDVSLAVKVS